VIILNLKIIKFQKEPASFLIKTDVFCGKINVRVKIKQFLHRLGQALRASGD
jgi:hypothetical protein